MTVSQPRIEVKGTVSAGWFGAREEAQLPVRGGGSAEAVGSPHVVARDSAPRAWLGQLRRALVDFTIVVAALTAVPVWTVSAAHGDFWQSRFRLRYSQAPARETETARAFMAPVDPTISPVEAGRAYFALLGRPQPSADFPPPPGLHVEAALPRIFLPRTMYRPDGRREIHSLFGDQMLEAASRGLSPDELNYLRKIATPSAWRDFDNVARAPAVDIVGGRFQLPFLPGATVWNMPVVQAPAFASVAELAIRRAAYHLAIGQRDSAEALLRLIISFGVHVGDNAPTVGDQFAGREVAEIGMGALARYYVITHDPRATAVRAGISNGEPIVPADFGSLPGPTAVTSDLVRRELIQRAGDPREQRGIRFASLEALSLAPCTNPRELIFGARADVRDAFERAKRDLARYPSEQAFIELIQRMPNVSSLPGEDRSSTIRQFLVGASTVASVVLHNPRLTGCVLNAIRGPLGR
jgi:hypothetical protein